MKNIIPEDTRYVPMTQQKLCCVPTSISIIMYRHGIPLLPQELLGYHLGLIAPEEDRGLFWNVRTGEKPEAGYGTQQEAEKYNLNTILQRVGIPLRAMEYPVGDFETESELLTFLTERIGAGKDILVRFDSGTINGTGRCVGHVCVIDVTYPEKNTVRFIETLPDYPKWREVTTQLLFEALHNHPTNNGVVWELEKIEL